jgi:hypothetical protein
VAPYKLASDHDYFPSLQTIAMPATRSPSRARSLPPYAKATLQSPLYEPGHPVHMPLPIMRSALFFADEDELPTVSLKMTLPLCRVSFKEAHHRSVSPPLPDEMPPLTDVSSESDDATPEEIPKPPGEPGRPDSGGYNIEQALSWDPSEFIRLKVIVQILHLGVTY